LRVAHSSIFELSFRTLFPHDKWRRLLSSTLRSETVQTGVYREPAGHPPLRAAIARHIGTARGMEITADDVTIVNGTQQGLDIVARSFIAPGDKVAVNKFPLFLIVSWY
jgi:GntR family transcriptional regulator/MocR family aminotransferase